ncbi:MAG: aminodeoxychorismate synthase component I [Desulfobulbaceae bacterium]|nr:aminodeoxychorismate synthase component I [Desulfobulbaceae bacterium]
MNKISRSHIASLVQYLDTKEEFILLDTSKPSSDDRYTLLFVDPVKWISCPADGDPIVFLNEAQRYHEQGYYLSGWFGYEFGDYLESAPVQPLGDNIAPLAVLGVFERPHYYDHLSGKFSSDFPGIKPSRDIESSYEINGLSPNISQQEYLRAINRIKNYISAGDTYQVNYTFKLDFSFSGSPAAFYLDLRNNQSVSYGAWIRTGGRDIMSFSPELFFRADKHAITVKPMKGTMKRGRTREEDGRLCQELANDPKNRSENVMIVDLLRNDLGRLLHESGGGEVRPLSLFDVESYETLLQMTSTIEGVTSSKDEFSLQKTFEALFPCGSVTGAPKVRTMEIIRELEKVPRGVYCGAIGYWGPDNCVFNVPIRTLTLQDGKGSMGIGSGIVHDSDPENEWKECLLKGNFLSAPRPDFQLIETVLWYPEAGYWLLDFHLARLLDSAAYFLFSPDLKAINDQLSQLELQLKEAGQPSRIRCLLHQDGLFELSSTILEQPFVEPTISPVDSNHTLPIVTFSTCRTETNNPFFYHKTTNRSLYNKERELALKNGFYEIFFLNTDDQVTEGSISNIFIKRDEKLFTPPLSSGLLPGTLRRLLLEQGQVEEKVITKHELETADAIYMGNSLRGLIQVRLVD